MKRKILVLFFVCMFFNTFLLTAMASYDSDSASWTSENASWGPDDGYITLESFDSSTDYCRCYTYATYDSLDLSSMMNYYNNDNLYPGLDITDLNNDFNAGVLSTTIPNPHFDTDNDFPYTNGDEEAEVTCESPGDINSNEQYYFRVTFSVADTCNTATFQYNTSESYWSGGFGEYQTEHYSQLGQDLTVNMP